MEEAFVVLESTPTDAETLKAVFRAAHTLKGSAAGLGFTSLSRFAHTVEDVLDRLRSGANVLTTPLATLLLQTVDSLRRLVKELRAEGIKPVLMTPPSWGEAARKNGAGEHPNLRLGTYVDACRKVARDTKTPLVDHFAYWEMKAKEGQKVGEWTTDQCHPNPRGMKEMTATMLPVIVEALQK